MTNKIENINDVAMEENYTVYMHVSPNGKRYIGITRNKPKLRWANGRGYKDNTYFCYAIQKYGWDNFEHIIIENNLTKEQAENMEIELIAKYRSNDREYGYNIENGGNATGKVSNETKKKISDALKGENSEFSIKIFCDKMIFVSITECANYYGIKIGTVHLWLQGKHKMNSHFQQLGLRIATNEDLNKYEKYDAKKHGDKASIVINVNNKGSSKSIHCDGIIFESMKECANYYGIKYTTMKAWLKGQNKMPLDFQKLNLRYATENDLNTYPRYTLANN